MTNVFKVNNISIVKKKNNFELNIKKKHNYSPFLFDSLKLSENLTVINEMKCLESGNCKMTFKAQNVLSLQTLIISFTSEGINDSGFSQKTCFFKLAHKIV